MSDVVIRAEGLGKKYLIGHQAQEERYVALRDVIARNTKGLMRSARDMLRGRQLIEGDEIEEFWALKDVSFEIKRGDVVGVIGRNGAGKSTLLKILSRITEPSTGRVEIKGRVASLLEVGTGFHPELTGRENIYLNGAILGMTRAEIKRKFDEIVAFAEVEKFLDTPVKRYSSGMYVRLAFAVAAHLEPEILVIDEVLAVGDAEFQKKCLGKMRHIAQHDGRTVLFVSHQLGMVTRLCDNSMLLRQGKLVSLGEVQAILGLYTEDLRRESPLGSSRRMGMGPYIESVITHSSVGKPTTEFLFDEEIVIECIVRGKITDPRTVLSITIVSKNGDFVSSAMTELGDQRDASEEDICVETRFPKNILAPKDFSFRVGLAALDGPVFDVQEMVCPIKILDNGSPMARYERYDYGQVVLDYRSTVKRLKETRWSQSPWNAVPELR